MIKKCKIEGCDRDHSAKGYCVKHYERFKRHVTTDDPSIPRDRGSNEERFWKYVNKAGEDECWTWKGGHGGSGHGVFMMNEGKPYKTNAHRAAWIIIKGPIDGNKQVNHKCKTKDCVNPNHLYLGTQKENMQDRSKDGHAYHWERPKGQGHGNSKFTDEQARYIKTCDRTDRDLAEKYNVTPECIHYIRHKGWKHICVN